MSELTGEDGERRRGRRGTYRKTARRRAEIVDAALAVFSQSGFRSGSIREIAERVGLTEAGVLHHFPSKRDLLVAVLEQRDEFTQEFMRSSSDDALTYLAKTIALAQNNADAPGVVELFCVVAAESTASDHPAHQYFVDRYVGIRAHFTAAFEHLAAAGELAEGLTVDYAVASTIALMDGLQIQWLLDRSAVDMVDVLRTHVRQLITVELPPNDA